MAAADKVTEPILIWGAGAIGGTIGAYWARAGVPVLLVDVVGEHVRACRTTGLEISGPVDEFKVVDPGRRAARTHKASTSASCSP